MSSGIPGSGSGGIRVNFPEGASFDLNARVASGSVQTDFPITIVGKISRRKLEGKVGDGANSRYVAGVLLS